MSDIVSCTLFVKCIIVTKVVYVLLIICIIFAKVVYVLLVDCIIIVYYIIYVCCWLVNSSHAKTFAYNYM